MNTVPIYTLDFNQVGLKDVATVGGKNASLGQLFNELKPMGVGVLDGFATTAEAYRCLLSEGNLETKLRAILSDFNSEDVDELARRGHAARRAVLETPLPGRVRVAILAAYDRLCARVGREPEMAVRSSAIVHDVSGLATVEQGDVLVAEKTDPDWEPVMKRVAAIVTDEGGRTAHAAIVSRELGLPCIVGTGNATRTLRNADEVTVSCAEGSEGRVYGGRISFEVGRIDAASVPETRTKVMLNVGDPGQAFSLALIPNSGVGLARMEFIITNHIGIHPMALTRFPRLKDVYAVTEIGSRMGEEEPCEFFIRRLSEGVGRIAAAFYPKPVIVRTSDFKTNEYARLTGGREFEPEEENSMLGFRGASRYYDPRYAEGFAIECEALARVRDRMGLKNVKVMIPFCRTIQEARQVLATMAANGLRQGEDGLEVYAMCEIPANVELAEQFLQLFDGYSIGSNDLTQLVLGIDRDSGTVAHLFDERNGAVQQMIARAIEAAKKAGKPIGICGQAPSDYPEFAAWLVGQGIDSISLNPDAAIKTTLIIAEAEKRDERAFSAPRLF